MREVHKKSAVPIYGIAVIWIIYALFFPMYKIWHFILLIVLSAGGYFLLQKLFPGKTEYVEMPEKPVSTGDATADEVIAEGKKAIDELHRLAGTIEKSTVKSQISELADIIEKIMAEIQRRPQNAPKIRRFMNYYIPTTLKLLNAYDRMDDQGIDGSNISASKNRIEDMLSTAAEAFKKQLDALFADEALDIETDITVMESLLKREGLRGNDF